MRNATHIGNNKRNRRHKPHSDGRHRPHPIPPHPHTELQDKCKPKLACGMCKKSRVGKNTATKTMRNATHTHTHTQESAEQKRYELESSAFFWYSVARRLSQFFARKRRKNRCENKTQVQFRVSKVPKLEFQRMPAKKSHHPARRQMPRAANNNNSSSSSGSSNNNNSNDDVNDRGGKGEL